MNRVPRLRDPRRSLEARLVGSFVALSFVMLGVVGLVAYRSARAELRSELEHRLASVGMLKEAELDGWVSEQREKLEFLATLPDLRSAMSRPRVPAAALEHLNELADLALGDGHDFSEVFVLSGAGGRVVASSDRGRIGAYHASEMFFLRGRAATYVQNVYPSPVTGRPALTVATPVRGPEGDVVGVLAGHLDLERLDELVHDRAVLGARAEAYLVSRFKEFISAQRFGREEYRREVHTDGVLAAIAGRSGVDLYDNYAGVPVIGSYRWIAARELILMVEVPVEIALAPARELLQKILLFGIAATLILMVGVRAIAVRVAAPLVAVSEAAAAVANGDFTVSAPEAGQDEVGLLAYAGRASFRVETLDLNSALDEMGELVAVSLPKKVGLEFDLSDEKIPVRADPAQVSQVAMNLITNAGQAIGEETGVVIVRTRISRDVKGNRQGVLSVVDTGCGMEQETRERIFDPFFSTKETGRGLGLAAVTGIVRGLGASIDVSSRVGEGTEFRVSFPLAEERAGEAASRSVEIGELEGGGEILVVDDEDSVRRFTKAVLRSRGFSVLEAEDGVRALEVYRGAETPPRAVVLDISMPRMNGREVLHELRKLDVDVPVLFTTGYDSREIGDGGDHGRHTRFLQKPYRSADLVKALHGLLVKTGSEEAVVD